jgi:A/G-specific adenine glycosylase
MIDPGDVLSWGLPRLRDLPWRRTRDPWHILVAEVMLQQTQVDRVIPKWEAFRSAYPTPAACAAVPLGDVLRLWHGLGYPRRARNLRDAAAAIVECHAGVVPDRLDALLTLPGIGPYTARAVLAFAFQRDEAVVDTNIARVLARLAGDRLTPKRAQALADSFVPRGEGWAWNQCLLDLGATVCRPDPRCTECPLATRCAWHRVGLAEPDPSVGSAGVSTPQSRFEGSERQARGRVLKTLTGGPAPSDAFPAHVVAGLVSDRLVVRDGGRLRLP